MQKGMMIALVAAGIIAIAAVAGVMAMTATTAPSKDSNSNVPPTVTTPGTGRNLTVDLNENLGLKSNT